MSPKNKTPRFSALQLATMLLRVPADTPPAEVDRMLHTQAGIEESNNKTAKNIHANLTLMMRDMNTDNVLDLYRRAGAGRYPAADWIEGRRLADASRARYYSSLLSVANPERAAAEIARHVPDHARDHFRARMRHYDRAVRDLMDENIADDRELKSILPWTDIVRAYCENRHALKPQQAVIADMYIGFADDPAAAPRRMDYNALRVYAKAPRPGAAPNYIVVRPPDTARIHLSEFKTAARRTEPISVSLPPGLAERIVQSLGQKPWRPYLLYRSRGPSRWGTPSRRPRSTGG
eukprot:jgi/Tetstr1/454257/TSEL_041176.t1